MAVIRNTPGPNLLTPVAYWPLSLAASCRFAPVLHPPVQQRKEPRSLKGNADHQLGLYWIEVRSGRSSGERCVLADLAPESLDHGSSFRPHEKAQQSPRDCNASSFSGPAFSACNVSCPPLLTAHRDPCLSQSTACPLKTLHFERRASARSQVQTHQLMRILGTRLLRYPCRYSDTKSNSQQPQRETRIDPLFAIKLHKLDALIQVVRPPYKVSLGNTLSCLWPDLSGIEIALIKSHDTCAFKRPPVLPPAEANTYELCFKMALQISRIKQPEIGASKINRLSSIFQDTLSTKHILSHGSGTNCPHVYRFCTHLLSNIAT